jgi:integrase
VYRPGLKIPVIKTLKCFQVHRPGLKIPVIKNLKCFQVYHPGLKTPVIKTITAHRTSLHLCQNVRKLSMKSVAVAQPKYKLVVSRMLESHPKERQPGIPIKTPAASKATTAAMMARQTRPLAQRTLQSHQKWWFLLDHDRKEWPTIVMNLTAKVSPHTRANYWGQVLGLLRDCEKTPTNMEKAWASKWTGYAHSQAGWRPVPAMTTAQFMTHRARVFSSFDTDSERDRKVGLASLVSFITGLRITDLWGLKTSDVTPKPNAVMITVGDGKTTNTTGAFSVPLPWCREATELVKMATTLPLQRGPIFVQAVDTEFAPEASLWSRRAKELLRRVDRRLEVKSLRRGGLQRLAEAGTATDTIRLVSRHGVKKDTLLHYLDRGVLNLNDHSKVIKAVSRSLPSFPWTPEAGAYVT